MLNSLPTYENVHMVYSDLELPYFDEGLLNHKKERLIYMIINLIRVKPQIFMH
jgi:hypothetical protein